MLIACVENYGKVVNDCREAVKLNPKNVKAYYRGAKAANALEKYEEALKFCEGGTHSHSHSHFHFHIHSHSHSHYSHSHSFSHSLFLF